LVLATSHQGVLRWAFLDRDGTINAKAPRGEYVTTPDQVEILDGAAGAIRRLNEAGIWVGIVTNQRGVALGRMTSADLDVVHERLFSRLASAEAHVDAVYVCPHEQGTCACRKPLPGLLLQAQQDVGDIDFSQAAIIGDSLSDIQAGRAVGTRTVLLASEGVEAGEADHVGPSLEKAVNWLLQHP
jgi:D-glycero-D-manno-heptose 1,7-bisphosphate phosphatase